MSGFAGVIYFDGRPSDQAVLRRMAAFLSSRGPDRQALHAAANAGFAFALLSTGDPSTDAIQPIGLGHALWIAGDIRLDDSAAFAASLSSATGRDLASRPHAELLLHAWRLWGVNLIDRIAGEFSFALWDAKDQTLFAARDHAGTRPFFFARSAQTFVFSNTLDCVRTYPDIPDQFNRLALADHLLFGLNQDPASTSYSAIRRLPPGHCGLFSAAGETIRRYWSLPHEEPLSAKDESAITEQWRDLLRSAVRDRFAKPRLGLLFSGGLASSSLAIAAAPLTERPADQVHALALTLENYPPRPASKTTLARAARLGIGCSTHPRDEELVDWNWSDAPLATPEPIDNPLSFRFERKFFEDAARWSRVYFTAAGAAAALHVPVQSPSSGFRSLLSFGKPAPPPPLPLPLSLWSRGVYTMPGTAFPAWLHPDLVSSLELERRWNDLRDGAAKPDPLSPLLWDRYFTTLGPGWTGAPVEFRFPFFDQRVLRFLLRLPPSLRAGSAILRKACQSALPKELLQPPPAAAPAKDPVHLLALGGSFSRQRLAGPLGAFIRLDRMPTQVAPSPDDFWRDVRVHALNHWLYHRKPGLTFSAPATGTVEP
jgi:asparagine synthase (glutamine-hydrolysing)